MTKKKRKKLGKLTAIPENNSPISGYSLMKLPYENVFYAKNCLEYLSENALKIRDILEKGKFEKMEKVDIDILNELVPTILHQTGYIEDYIRPKNP